MLPKGSLSWTSSGTPRSDRFQDVYYSERGGMQESFEVYFQGNLLGDRVFEGCREICIGELGFGTGLNFLTTYYQQKKNLKKRTLVEPSSISFFSCEKYPMKEENIRKAIVWPELQECLSALLENYRKLGRGWNRFRFDECNFELFLFWGDVLDYLKSLSGMTEKKMHAWYLDGFTPRKNPSMWTEEVFVEIAKHSLPEITTFSTFTAASWVRRNAEKSGFEVFKCSGFGSKRESLRGRLRGKN